MSARTPGPGLAWAYALRKFGGGIKLVETPARAISSVTPTQVLLNDPDRVFWIIENLSPYSGTLAFNNQVTLGTGLLIVGLGGWVSLSVDEDGEAVTYSTWAIESVAGQTWYITEIVKA